MSILDIVIILLLLGGAIYGSHKGFIRSIVDFVGTFASILIAFVLTKPVADFMYTHFPYFEFGGLSAYNIVIYEVIAFIIILAILFSIVQVLVKISGLIEKILNATIILGIPSKILGAIFGFCEGFVIIFIILFLLNQIPATTGFVNESKTAQNILEKTPLLSNICEETFDSMVEIYEIKKQDMDTEELNKQIFEILLKDKIISTEKAKELVKDGKIKVVNADEIIKKYE